MVERQERRWIIAILLLAFSLRLGWILYSPSVPTNDFMRYATYGVRIADGLGFSSVAGPTAFSPPLYPYFLAGIFMLFGQAIMTVKLMQVLLGTLTVLLTYLLARQLFATFTAYVAALMTASAPSLISYTALFATENLTLPLLMGSILCLVIDRRSSVLASGSLLGLTALTRAAFLLLPLAWLFYLLVTRQSLRPLTWLTLGMSVTLLPWTIRNYVVFDAFIPISTNGGYNLLISFNAESNGIWQERQVGNALGSHFVWETTRLENGMSEVELDRRARQIAFDFMRAEPLAALRLAPRKFWLTVRDDVSGITLNLQSAARELNRNTVQALRGLAQLHYVTAVGLAMVGLWRHRPNINRYERPPSTQPYLPLIPLLFLLFVHTIFFGDDRFHLPILPLLYIYSGAAFINRRFYFWNR